MNAFFQFDNIIGLRDTRLEMLGNIILNNLIDLPYTPYTFLQQIRELNILFGYLKELPLRDLVPPFIDSFQNLFTVLPESIFLVPTPANDFKNIINFDIIYKSSILQINNLYKMR
jgi:hypothetical protein